MDVGGYKAKQFPEGLLKGLAGVTKTWRCTRRKLCSHSNPSSAVTSRIFSHFLAEAFIFL